MPFRTKDFLLFIVTVAFLLLGIAGTIISDVQSAAQANTAAVVQFVSSEESYEAELSSTRTIGDRAERLASLRAAVTEKLGSAPPAPVLTPEPSAPTSETPPVPTDRDQLDRCPNYQVYTGAWDPANLTFEVVEGARLLFKDVPLVNDAAATLSEALSSVQRQTVLQLPLQTAPNRQKTCLSSDVVGVALHGSLIRNNEVALYQIFPESTLIGYALDGFPIYGLSNQPDADRCGGRFSTGEYAYYLAEERPQIINCFAGTPAVLP